MSSGDFSRIVVPFAIDTNEFDANVAHIKKGLASISGPTAGQVAAGMGTGGASSYNQVAGSAASATAIGPARPFDVDAHRQSVAAQYMNPARPGQALGNTIDEMQASGRAFMEATSSEGIAKARSDWGYSERVRIAQERAAQRAQEQQIRSQGRLDHYAEGRDTAYENRNAADLTRTSRLLDRAEQPTAGMRGRYSASGAVRGTSAADIISREAEIGRFTPRTGAESLVDDLVSSIVRGDRHTQKNFDDYASAERKAMTSTRNYFNDIQRSRIRGEDKQNSNEAWHDRDQISARREQRINEDFVTKRDIREGDQFDKANLRMRLANSWTRAGDARILEAEARNVGWNTSEGMDYRARAVEQRKGGFFGRPSGMALYFQAMFGGMEVAGAYAGAARMSASLARTPEQVMSMQTAALGQMQGGFFGALASLPVTALDLAHGAQGFSGTLQGPGLIGDVAGMFGRITTPNAVAYAQQQAHIGMAAVSARTAAIVQESNVRHAGFVSATQNLAILATDPFKQKRFALAARGSKENYAIEDEGVALTEAWKDAESLGNQEQMAELRGKISGYNRTLKYRQKTSQDRIAAETSVVDREEIADIVMRRGANYANRTQMAGESQQALEVATRMGFRALLAGEDVRPGVEEAYNNAMNAVAIAGSQRKILAAGSHAAVAASLANNPLEAQLAQIGSQFLAATAGMQPLSSDWMAAAVAANDQSALARKSFGDQTALIGMGLSTRTRQLNQLLGRNPIGAASTGAAGNAMQEAEQLILSGRSQQAGQSLVNGMLEQRMIKQDYLESFRAVQFDGYNNVLSPRDVADPNDAMKAIDQNVAIIANRLATMTIYQ